MTREERIRALMGEIVSVAPTHPEEPVTQSVPYTDADVELVASTFAAEAKKNPIDTATPPWMGAQTRRLLAPTGHDIARAVLNALAAAGRLRPIAERTRDLMGEIVSVELHPINHDPYPASVGEVADEIARYVLELDDSGLASGLADKVIRRLRRGMDAADPVED